MVKERVYVESSVISFLAARTARDAQKRMWQQQTALWWERRHEWDCVVSATVLEEIAEGDPEAATRRLEKAQSLVKVPTSPDADVLAELLVLHKLVPESVKSDAVHLAMAAVHGASWLLTWNQKHLANIVVCSRIEDFIRRQGWQPAKVVTPEQLLKESQ